MKKRIIYLIIAIITFASCCLISACFVSTIDRKKMTIFYSNNSNYEVIEGKITYSNLSSENGARIIWLETEDNIYTLKIIPYNENELNKKGIILDAGEDKFSITTSTKTWWDGYIFPIVAIDRIADNEELLDFETGKENLLYWIQNDLR